MSSKKYRKKKQHGSGLGALFNGIKNVVSSVKNVLPQTTSQTTNAQPTAQSEQPPFYPQVGPYPVVKPIPDPSTSPMSMMMSKASKSLGIGDIDMTSLGGVFYILVMGCILLAVGTFFVLCIVAFYAIFLHSLNEWNQSAKLEKTQLLIQDTTDWTNMDYMYNDLERDPYFIYFQQGLLSTIFQLLALAIFLMLFQGAVYLGMSIWASLRDEDFKEKYKHNVYVLGCGVILLVIALILRSLYNNSFLKSTQLELREMIKYLINIKEKLYDNMTMDSNFLQALTQDSTYALSNMITSAAGSFSSSKNPENHALVRMAFTYNLYKFYYNNIPNHNRATHTLREVFTSQGIKQRTMLLPLLFSYQSPPLIQNVFYTDYQNILKESLGEQSMQRFTVALQERMILLDKELRTLPDIQKAKYLISSFNSKFLSTIILYFLALILFITVGKYIYNRIQSPK